MNKNIRDYINLIENAQIGESEGVAEGLSEARNSLFAFVKQQFPTWPDYVLKDFLYQQAKGIRDQAELDDFLKRNKQDFGNCKWTLTKLPITFDIFTPKTQRMLASREGGSSNPFQVPRDAERHAQQSQMIQQKGVSAEPIIVAKLSNGYDLIEGWHRTIQHLKAFPQGYTGPAWVCTGATYKSESVEQGVAEGQLELNTPDPVVVVQDLKGNILDKINLSVAAQKYKLGQPQTIKNQLAHQNYTKVGNYTIVSPMSGQPQDATTQGVAETELDEKSVSQAQFRTMAGAAHNPEFARKVGISQDVAQEFNQADKKSNYKKLPARATEGEQQKGADYRDPREVDYDDAYDSMVARVKKLAGLGPMKTTYDPAKRQYRNQPTAQQPKK
jgi:hypothetical protein